MIVFDTGPLVAAAIPNQRRHHACVELLTGSRLAGRRLILPPTVTAEVGYFLNRYGSPAVEAAFLGSVAAGDFETVDLTPADYRRMSELVSRYADLPLGTTDASVIAVAERLGATEVATLDLRHFSVVRPRHIASLALVPSADED
ncbi:MAG: PIN domain-containing protein [Aeromicrobium sp.]|uniref:type II toxin-antitoxin system VapC family toxin n=1 Tax=Aeromicrobium sp. TaxID=1871063 RepID=UPI0039E68D33